MKYIFYSTTAIPCETDLAKAKEKLSFLGKPKEYNCFHHDFKGFKIENIFNDNLFVEEINETIHFKCDVIILQFAFIYTQFQFEVSDSSSFGEILLNDEKGNNFYFKPREELKKIKIESLHDIQTKLLLFNFYNIESFQDNFKKFDVTLSLHQQAPIIKDAIKKHTLAIPSMFSTTISTSTGEIYIESNSREQTNLIINHKKLKVWKNNKQDDGSYFFNGDLEKLEEALIHYRITISLLYGHMYLLGAVLTDAAKASEDIQKKITNKNPIFWDNLSLDIEYVQLEFVNIQRIISGQLVRLQNSTVLKNLYVEKHYEDFNNNIQQKIKHIFSLAKEVNSALINMSTPIKAKNDFRKAFDVEQKTDALGNVKNVKVWKRPVPKTEEELKDLSAITKEVERLLREQNAKKKKKKKPTKAELKRAEAYKPIPNWSAEKRRMEEGVKEANKDWKKRNKINKKTGKTAEEEGEFDDL